MPNEDGRLSLSPEMLDHLSGALRNVPIDELRQFVALMEATFEPEPGFLARPIIIRTRREMFPRRQRARRYTS
ncbi:MULTISPECIES: hypothetical protein [Bradyrhizobium]|uniref:hypothetical protein n=1 Tax=Bradyrhizobium elkanii TaxID=29448 RepID=UPI0003F4FF7F|nr:hypothetical protein [Bradyrhizobium elkanii]